MKFSEFESSLSQAEAPAGLTNALCALWYAGKSDWESAHNTCQKQEGTPDSDWVHAYLHREEGDLPNAEYWYRRAGREVPQCSLKEEWATIVVALIAKQS